MLAQLILLRNWLVRLRTAHFSFRSSFSSTLRVELETTFSRDEKFNKCPLMAHAHGGVIAHWRGHRALEPAFHSSSGRFAVSCFCYFFIPFRLATLALRLGVLSASWLLSEAFVFQRCSPMYAVWVRLVLQLYAV